MMDRETARLRAVSAWKTRREPTDKLRRLLHGECRPIVTHGASVRSTNSGASRQGTARLMRNAACSPCSSREQWRHRRDIGHGFRWKRLACREVLFIPRRTRVIGRKEACRSEAIVHLFEIGGARQYVVVRVKWVETETIANAEFYPGARHELHQAHRTARRDRVLVASAFNLDDGTNPARRHGEAIGGFLDEFGEPIGGLQHATRSVRTRSIRGASRSRSCT